MQYKWHSWVYNTHNICIILCMASCVCIPSNVKVKGTGLPETITVQFFSASWSATRFICISWWNKELPNNCGLTKPLNGILLRVNYFTRHYVNCMKNKRNWIIYVSHNWYACVEIFEYTSLYFLVFKIKSLQKNTKYVWPSS